MDSTFAERGQLDRVWGRLNLRLNRASWLLVGITLAGALLRVYLLGDKSIWLDEAFSIALSQRALADLLRLTVLADTHPPLYYVSLKYWMLLGQSEAIVRLLSALFSTAAIPAMYLLASALYEDKKAGLLGAVILAFSPFQIWYAQEARMYAMLTFFVLASAYFLIRALRSNQNKDWTAYAVATALALYTDNGALWYVVAVALFFLLSRKRFAGRMRKWLLSQGAVLLLFAPWVPFLLRQTQQVTESFWLLPPSFQTVLGAFLDFNSFNFPWIALSVLYMTVVFVWATIVPNGGWQRRLAMMWLFVPLVVSLLLSLRQPIFLSRNLIAASLGYYLLVVDTIKKFDSPRATVILLAPLLIMNLVSTGANAWVEKKADWRTLAEEVAQSAASRGEGLILFVPSYAELPFSYYFRQHGVDVETQGYPEDELLLHPDPQEIENLEDLLAGQPAVWLVLRDVETVDPQWEVKAWLDSNGYVRGPEFSGEEISALTYYRWDTVEGGAQTPQAQTPQAQTPEAPASGPRADPTAPGEETVEETVEGTYSTFMPLVHGALRGEVIVAPTPVIHVIAPGDTLWVIARRYGTSVEAIMEANGISSPNRLRVGQELVIP